MESTITVATSAASSQGDVHFVEKSGLRQTREQRRLVEAERMKALELSRKAAELAKAAAEGAALAAQPIDSPTSNLPHKPTPKPSGFNSDHDAFLALQMTEFARLPKQEQEDMLDPVKRHQRGVLGAKGEYADELADEEDYGALAKFAD
nr:hypothetical protein B0A51_13773 [Rachicladosporium sp. CCFEE 5018]